VGILQRLDAELKQCQALVLAPTRELAQQIVKVISALGDFMGLKIHACVGGTAVRDDIRTLQDGVHIVVGTPGRVYDMIQRRALRLESVKLFGTYALHTLCFCYTCVHVVFLLCTGVWTDLGSKDSEYLN
jgi:translation initiation factor 4A